MSLWGSKPLGPACLAPFFLRVSVGIFLILTGARGFEDFKGFTEDLAHSALYAHVAGPGYAAFAPFVLIAVGGLLLIGLWTVGASLVGVIFFLPIFIRAGLFNLPDSLFTHRLLFKDACLLGACLALCFTGGGFLSIDRLMKADTREP